MFNYDEVAPFRELGSYHNSYLEIFFGGGIILFILFCLFMVFRPVGNYFKYYSKIFLIFPPLAIIPFFESNLTGGQFLFYPWFMLMLLFNLAPPDVSKNTANKHVRVGNYPLPRNIVYRWVSHILPHTNQLPVNLFNDTIGLYIIFLFNLYFNTFNLSDWILFFRSEFTFWKWLTS